MLCAIAVFECDVGVLCSLRQLLLSSAAEGWLADSERLSRLQRVSELLAQSACTLSANCVAPAVSTPAAACQTLLHSASEWCLPHAVSGSLRVAFSGCNQYAAAQSVVWLAQRVADKHQASQLFAYSTTLHANTPSGWHGVARSASDAANSQLAARLQQFNDTVA